MKKLVALLAALLVALPAPAQVIITEPGISPATIDTNTLAIVDGKLTVLGGGGGGGAWGGIGGTLSDQVDLWSELTNRYTAAEVLALLDADAVYQRTTNYVSSGATTVVAVDDRVPIYRISITSSTELVWDLSALDYSRGVATWEAFITLSATNLSLMLPDTDTVYYVGGVPDISTTEAGQTHYTVWRAWEAAGVTNLWMNKWETR